MDMYVNVKFPDNNIKKFKKNDTFKDIAKSISVSFYKKTLIASYNNIYYNLNNKINIDGDIKFILKNDKEKSIDILKNTSIIILAYALELEFKNIKFYSYDIKNEGFYIDFKTEHKISKNNFKDLEKQIKNIINENYTIETIDNYNKINNFKINLLKNPQKVADISKKIGEIKLLEISGVHLDGNKENIQIQRIYAYNAENTKEIKQYLDLIDRRKQNDHRKIGRDLSLFSFDDLVGQGMAIWMPNGSIIRRELERYIVDLELKKGYKHVYTPVLATRQLYETSGHLEHYLNDIFPIMKVDDEEFVLRPMNCPHHMMLYKKNNFSYRELPVRIAELGIMHRYEKSGALLGLERVRGMCLNDAHIFIRPDQIEEEIKNVLDLINIVYKDLDIKPLYYRLSLRDHNKEKYYNDDEMWEKSQTYLRNILNNSNIKVIEKEGEAAFYGPKIDIQVNSVIGHEFTLSTIQLDFLLPEKFNLSYIDKDGIKKRPVVIHRGILSTMERMTAFLIERYKGLLPLWLSPEQIRIIPISIEKHSEYCKCLEKELLDKNIRANVDLRKEKLNYKIRDAQLKKIPICIIIGDDEIDYKKISFRIHGQKETHSVDKKLFIEKILKMIKEKRNILDLKNINFE